MKTPQEIKNYLDQYVIGHDLAKKSLAVAAYTHSKVIQGNNIKKTNVLIIGPTGCGKTYIVSHLAKILNVGFLTTDATKFTSSGYTGRNVEELASDLVMLCEGDEEKAQKSIIYIDEIDKIRKKGGDAADVNGLGVQQSLLKLIEGTELPYVSKYSRMGEHDRKLDTKNIMFICSGAFVGLNSPSVTDLVNFGMIPEFLGRFSIITQLQPLTFENFKTILAQSRGSILISFREWFEQEGIELLIQESALDAIATKAMRKGLGARGLQSILDEALLNSQFELPSMNPKPKAFLLDGDVVNIGQPKWIY